MTSEWSMDRDMWLRHALRSEAEAEAEAEEDKEDSSYEEEEEEDGDESMTFFTTGRMSSSPLTLDAIKMEHWTPYFLSTNVRMGNIETVRMLRSKEALYRFGTKCPWDASALEAAIRDRNIEMLRLLRSGEAADPSGARCPWTENTFCAAVESGDMTIVRYLRSKEACGPLDLGLFCPWSARAFSVAVRKGSQEMIGFLLSTEGADVKGTCCPVDDMAAFGHWNTGKISALHNFLCERRASDAVRFKGFHRTFDTCLDPTRDLFSIDLK